MRKCAWKQVVELLSNPEGHLRICDKKCDGYDINCETYTDSIKGIIEPGETSFREVPTGLERFFTKYPLYKCSNN